MFKKKHFCVAKCSFHRTFHGDLSQEQSYFNASGDRGRCVNCICKSHVWLYFANI